MKKRTNLRSHIELFNTLEKTLVAKVSDEYFEEGILEADHDNNYVEDGMEIINHKEEIFDKERTPIESREHNTGRGGDELN